MCRVDEHTFTLIYTEVTRADLHNMQTDGRDSAGGFGKASASLRRFLFEAVPGMGSAQPASIRKSTALRNRLQAEPPQNSFIGENPHSKSVI